MTERSKGSLAGRIKAEEARPKEIKKTTRDATVRLNVPLDPVFHAKLKATAAMSFQTIESVVKQALEMWLADHDMKK